MWCRAVTPLLRSENQKADQNKQEIQGRARGIPRKTSCSNEGVRFNSFFFRYQRFAPKPGAARRAYGSME